MKKIIYLILSIATLVFTFMFAEIFSIYHFGSIPTFLTISYLISIFSIFEHLAISITYVIRKKIKKEKLGFKIVLGLILFFIALLLVFLFLIVVDIDYLNWYLYSSPFYLNVIYRSVEFLVPSIALIMIGTLLLKNKK